MEARNKKFVAELVGTFMFVLVGAGSAVASSYLGLDKGTSLIVAAFANGIGLGVAVSSTMGISGGHLNPAVSIALAIGKKFKTRDLLQYIVSQLIGAFLASYVISLSFPKVYLDSSKLGSPSLAQGLNVLQGILMEGALTFVLIIAVFGTAVDQRAPKIGGFGIGLAVFVDVLFGGPLTGAAMNPARAMGPMVISGFVPSYWYIYWIGPILGAAIAALVYRYLIE